MQILARIFSVTRAKVSTVTQRNIRIRENDGLKMQPVTKSRQSKTGARLYTVIPRDMLAQRLESVIGTLKLNALTKIHVPFA